MIDINGVFFLLLRTLMGKPLDPQGIGISKHVNAPEPIWIGKPHSGQADDIVATIFEGVLDGILVAEAETGAFIAANSQICTMLGYSREELSGLRISNIHPEHELQIVRNNLDRLKKGGLIIAEAVQVLRKDGTVFFADINSKIINLRGNECFVGVFRDITERRNSEIELFRTREHERIFSERLALLSEVITELSRALTPQELFRRVIELGRSKLDIDRLSLWFFSEDRRSMVGTFGVDAEGNVTDERDARFLLSPESKIWPVVAGEALLLKFTDASLFLNGKVVGRGSRIASGLWDGERVIGFMSIDNLFRKRSFTVQDEELIRLFASAVGHLASLKRAEEDRKNLQEQLIQAHKLESVGRLAGGVAHDFNNMLSVILGYSEMAMGALGEDHNIYAYLKEIFKAAKRSADLTSQLLAFARKQVATPVRINLNKAIPGVLNFISRLLGENIKVDWKPQEELWDIFLDPVQLDQVLANLCVNARDAITGSGSISLSTANLFLDKELCHGHEGCIPGEYVRISVEDTGCGMSETIKAHIFEPFFTTKGMGQGTGLGLATVYGIVRQNSGIIHVDSEPGKGTIISIFFPRLVSHEDKPKEEESVTRTTNKCCETILLVEDEPQVLEYNRIFLKEQGFIVLSASHPDQGMRIAETHPGDIDLLITDVIMPGEDGRTMASRIEKLRPGIKTLLMSGYSDASPHGAKDKGWGFIRKPFSLTELSTRIRQILDSRPAS